MAWTSKSGLRLRLETWEVGHVFIEESITDIQIFLMIYAGVDGSAIRNTFVLSLIPNDFSCFQCLMRNQTLSHVSYSMESWCKLR